MATQPKRKASDAASAADRPLVVSVELDAPELAEEESRNARLFLEFQLARWCVKTKRVGRWRLRAVLEGR